jgi:hypothetical protein
MKNSLLAVYNICGIKGDNTKWYIECIHNLLNQNLDNTRILVSSCKNSKECIKELYSTFGNRISYCVTPELHTVNVTFNNSVRKAVEHFGEFDSYMYIDSGCNVDNQDDIFYLSYKCLVDNDYGIVVVQTDTDECLHDLGNAYVYESPEIQVKGKDLVVPIGVSINQHTALFSNKIFKSYKKLYPDVFAAFCSESVLNYIAASVGLRWVIMADKQVRHAKAVDGPSSGFTHRVESRNKKGEVESNNFWNNLLYGRDVLDFLNDDEAYQAGLGYEETNNVMLHNPNAYTADGLCKNPDRLKRTIEKYLFLNEEELKYENIKCKFIP